MSDTGTLIFLCGVLLGLDALLMYLFVVTLQRRRRKGS